ncbi:hypothetical protein NQ318_004093 [Aromia moschata]|uniref:Uncharacterized protein n=1 Tax=Aromia moschata TaxID=1265417 RepID=A0AAV8XU27_9CUCU|nr:hypothetical protein NQ318_004093 [Aromia moschata]
MKERREFEYEEAVYNCNNKHTRFVKKERTETHQKDLNLRQTRSFLYGQSLNPLSRRENSYS